MRRRLAGSTPHPVSGGKQERTKWWHRGAATAAEQRNARAANAAENTVDKHCVFLLLTPFESCNLHCNNELKQRVRNVIRRLFGSFASAMRQLVWITQSIRIFIAKHQFAKIDLILMIDPQ